MPRSRLERLAFCLSNKVTRQTRYHYANAAAVFVLSVAPHSDHVTKKNFVFYTSPPDQYSISTAAVKLFPFTFASPQYIFNPACLPKLFKKETRLWPRLSATMRCRHKNEDGA